MFEKINLKDWKRKPYFDLYFNQMKCTYSITVNMDITRLMTYKQRNNTKLYPLLIYAIAKSVNTYQEFRTAMDTDGNIGIWDVLHPCFTVFHKETETFSNIWTEWNNDLQKFLSNWTQDIEQFGKIEEIDPKPNTPTNVFPISTLPWTTFTGFNLNIVSDGKYLLPIFTFGKHFTQQDKILIPLSIQVHHAICDGFLPLPFRHKKRGHIFRYILF